MVLYSANDFEILGSQILQKNYVFRRLGSRQFKACFGCSPNIVSIIWKELEQRRFIGKAQGKHFLWFLMMCKVYPSESIASLLVGSTEKTYRKWCHHFLCVVPRLKLVSKH